MNLTKAAFSSGSVRSGVSGLKRNPRSSLNLTHGTGLHIGDSDTPPEVQPRTLVIHGITPELGDEQLRADLEVTIHDPFYPIHHTSGRPES